MPVAANIYGSQASRTPATVSHGPESQRQPCRLSDIPLLRYHEEDASRYLTAGL